MPFVESNGLRWYRFDSFPGTVSQAVFTRRGGDSPSPWTGLNLGGSVGDDPARVRTNRERAFSALGRPAGSLYDVWQVHSVDWVYAAAPRPLEDPMAKADIILTDRPEVTIVQRFADCVPVLLYDPVRHALAAAHSGWMGTVRGAARAAVEAMTTRFGSRPADLLAAIGPSIGPDHYEIGPDVAHQVQAAFGTQASALLLQRAGSVLFDLWAANRLLLEQAGVGQIELAGLCTACHLEDWFSHRAEHGRTGRFGVLFGLEA